MSTNNFERSDLPRLHNFIQSSMLSYPKELIIATLRDLFSKDSYYHYSKDQWGFANTTDHTDLALGGDMPSGTDIVPTRLFIGENYRYDGIYYPAILIKAGGGKYVPLSATREQGSIQYDMIIYEDGYGNQTPIRRPAYFITAGAWEGQIIIDVMTRSLRSRDDIVETILHCFTELAFDTLQDVGVLIKPPSYSGPSEADDRNDKLFKQSITLDIRTEWRREIPILNLIDRIVLSVTIENLENPNAPVSPNLTINADLNILDIIP